MKLRIGQSSISIERGDITDWEVDAIINAANSTLSMSTGVASAIKRKGGVIIDLDRVDAGVEVIEEIVAAPCRSVVIAAGSTPDIDLVVRAVQAGAHDFLNKAFDPNKLCDQVQETWKRILEAC